MSRFFASLFFGLLVGAGLGLYLGWVQFPVTIVDGPAINLDQRYKDEYTVMVASGFLVDGDPVAAVDRLRVLGEANVPEYVQRVTERYISTSRDVNDIYFLVALAEGLGRLTPVMEPYRLVNVIGATP